MVTTKDERDLTLTTDWGVFNHRVGYLAFNEDSILLQYSESHGFWFIPGGRIAFGDDAETTIHREAFEELGLKNTKPEFASVVENFYFFNGHDTHEVNFYFRITLPENFTLPTTEQCGKPIHLEWKKLDDLKNTNLLPTFLKEDVLKMKSGFHHFNHRD